MLRIKYLILGLGLAVLTAGLFFVRQSDAPSPVLSETLPEIIEAPGEPMPAPPSAPIVMPETKKEVSAPPPLRLAESEPAPAIEPAPKIVLNQQTVIAWTNIQRVKSGLVSLKENSRLNAAAEAKIKDMFENQYFEHQSPSGKGAGDLAEDFGYEFLAVGENLALGNFPSDENLVEAWMASPGHRANILNTSYEEIGVAVGEGAFEGKTTWLAVQHFGRPLSDCPYPNQDIEKEIDKNRTHMAGLREALDALRTEIDNTEPKNGEVYIKKIEQYNLMATEYNFFVETTKAMIGIYNSQVTEFNLCAGT